METTSDSLGKVLPRRVLGRSGERVTMLGLGGFHVGWTTEGLARAVIEAALEEGIRFFDTAESYGEGTSELRYGKFLVPQFRKHVFLMTKTTAKDAVTARAHLEGSLRRLGVEAIDLWQMHALESPEDVDARIKAGVLDVLLEAQASGKVRHLGFTGHGSPYAHLRMLERLGAEGPFSALQMPVNPVDAASPHSFTQSVIPQAARCGTGVLAMKTLADGRFFSKKRVHERVTWETDRPLVPGQLTVGECLGFAWSHPISVLITGAENPEFVREKAAICRQWAGMDDGQREVLVRRVGEFAREGRVEYYKNIR
jgi:uncharacterized protein